MCQHLKFWKTSALPIALPFAFALSLMPFSSAFGQSQHSSDLAIHAEFFPNPAASGSEVKVMIDVKNLGAPISRSPMILTANLPSAFIPNSCNSLRTFASQLLSHEICTIDGSKVTATYNESLPAQPRGTEGYSDTLYIYGKLSSTAPAGEQFPATFSVSAASSNAAPAEIGTFTTDLQTQPADLSRAARNIPTAAAAAGSSSLLPIGGGAAASAGVAAGAIASGGSGTGPVHCKYSPENSSLLLALLGTASVGWRYVRGLQRL